MPEERKYTVQPRRTNESYFPEAPQGSYRGRSREEEGHMEKHAHTTARPESRNTSRSRYEGKENTLTSGYILVLYHVDSTLIVPQLHCLLQMCLDRLNSIQRPVVNLRNQWCIMRDRRTMCTKMTIQPLQRASMTTWDIQTMHTGSVATGCPLPHTSPPALTRSPLRS